MTIYFSLSIFTLFVLGLIGSKNGLVNFVTKVFFIALSFYGWVVFMIYSGYFLKVN